MTRIGELRTDLAYRRAERRCKKDGHLWLAEADSSSGYCRRCGCVTLDRAKTDAERA